MSQLTVSPYINFQGHAREALEFYQRALGGELTLLTFNSDGAPKEASPDDAIMHGMLRSDDVMILATDGMPQYPPAVGDNMAITLMGYDKERLTQVFEALSEGGNVKQSLKTEAWGDTFGWLEDKFKINWMVNITHS